MKPFENKPYFEPSFFDKISKSVPKNNFLIDLNNYLSITDLDELTIDKFEELASKYKIKNPYDKFYDELCDILFEFVTFHLGSKESKTNNIKSFKCIQKFLQLNDDDFERIVPPLTLAKFTLLVTFYFRAEKKYGDSEKALFAYAAENYGLSKEVAESVIKEIGEDVVKEYYVEIFKDRRISPEEEKAGNELINALNVKHNFSINDKNTAEKFKKLWQIENGEMDETPVDIILQKNEKCFFASVATLCENRTITKSVGYAGPTFRLKIAKGLYYRVGNFATKRDTEDVMTRIDNGVLYITNKRILFVGKQNKPIKYSQIIDLKLYTDGIEIFKDSGKSPLFIIQDADSEIALAIIVRQIQDN
jgi:hypothetical protein